MVRERTDNMIFITYPGIIYKWKNDEFRLMVCPAQHSSRDIYCGLFGRLLRSFYRSGGDLYLTILNGGRELISILTKDQKPRDSFSNHMELHIQQLAIILLTQEKCCNVNTVQTQLEPFLLAYRVKSQEK